MFYTTKTVDNVINLGIVEGDSCYGIGFITAICYSFCMLLGWPSESMRKKLELSKAKALNDMFARAREKGAIGIMEVSYQVTGLNVFVYGTAYKSRPANSENV